MAHSTFSINLTTGQGATNSNNTLADNLSAFSVSFWMKTSAAGVILNKSAGGFLVNRGWGIDILGSSKVDFQLYDGATHNPTFDSSNTVCDSAWHNIVCTWNGTTGKVYVDGIDVTVIITGGVSGNYSTTASLEINTSASYHDKLDDMRIWNTALTSSDATTIFAGGDPSTPPIAYWKIEEGSGVTLGDSTGNGNVMTFGSAPIWSSDVPAPLAGFALSLSDTVVTSDALATLRHYSRTLSDSVTPASALKKNIDKTLNDFIFRSDNADAHIASRQLNESVLLTDWVTLDKKTISNFGD